MQTVASSLGFVSVSVWCGILDWASALMTKGKKKKRTHTEYMECSQITQQYVLVYEIKMFISKKKKQVTKIPALPQNRQFLQNGLASRKGFLVTIYLSNNHRSR